MASTTYNNQGVSAEIVVQGLTSHEGNISVSVHEAPGRRLEMLNWLSHVSIEKQHEDLRSDLIIAEDSGRWFLESDQYLDWINPANPNRILWCPGLPGAGKTVMASLVIDRLLKDAAGLGKKYHDSICWLYLGHEAAKGRPDALLRALLRHLVLKSENVPRSIKDLYLKHLEAKTSPTNEKIMSCLVEVCRDKENIFLVVDAMDEYPEAQRSHLIRHIRDMLDRLPGLRILVTSRLIQTIQDELGSSRRHDIEAHDDDLDAFIRTQLDLSKYRHTRRFSLHTTDNIINTVIRHSDKM